jgi:hypothetical protein
VFTFASSTRVPIVSFSACNACGRLIIKPTWALGLAWWYKSVIPATQEVESQKIMVPSHSKQKVCKTLSQKRKGWAQWYVPVILAAVGKINRRTAVQAGQGKSETLSQKQLEQKEMEVWLK